MEASGDNIAGIVLRKFNELPKKRKPQLRGDGVREWVPLSGIVAEVANGLQCIALGTGMKCLPESKISQANGTVLHDWHAEIVCIRALNVFLLTECMAVTKHGRRSDFITWQSGGQVSSENFQPFAIRDEVKFHMYCSEAPCGDASMELTMAAQEDDTPWETPSSVTVVTATGGPLNGRGYFSQLGVVRRKPSRPDAPPTLSKSCSDKISLRQCTSLLSSITTFLINPKNAYIHSLTMPQSQHSQSGCERAFGLAGRLSPLVVTSMAWGGGYALREIKLQTTSLEFEFSRRVQATTLVASNLAALWTPHCEESLIGGVLQGRKLFDPRGASAVSRKNMWAMARNVAQEVVLKKEAEPDLTDDIETGDSLPPKTCHLAKLIAAVECKDYTAVKASTLLTTRRKVKDEVIALALKGWTMNQQDAFELD